MSADKSKSSFASKIKDIIIESTDLAFNKKIVALEKTVNHLNARIGKLESKLSESQDLVLALSLTVEQFLESIAMSIQKPNHQLIEDMDTNPFELSGDEESYKKYLN